MFRIKLPIHTGQKRTFFTKPENNVRLGITSVGENSTGSAAATPGNADRHRFSFSFWEKCPPELAGEKRAPEPIKKMAKHSGTICRLSLHYDQQKSGGTKGQRRWKDLLLLEIGRE